MNWLAEKKIAFSTYNQLHDIHDVIVVYDNDIPIGCVSFKKYDTNCAEVKRVFIRQAYRGKGLSKKLMQLLEATAKEKGYTYLVLETGKPLVEAIGLYRNIGYEVIPNYGQYKDMLDSICMKKEL